MVRRNLSALLFFVLLAVSVALAQQQPASLASLAGTWDARLIPMTKQGPAPEVPFGLVIESAQGISKAAIMNGSERMDFSSVVFDGITLTLRLDQYDGQIVATYDAAKRELTGEYTRQTRAGVGRYGFRATPKVAAAAAPEHPWTAASLDGSWTVTFTEDQGSSDRIAPAVFTQEPAHLSADGKLLIAPVSGTIAPVSGDFGLMSGTVSVPLVNGKPDASAALTAFLSRFDGIHVMRLTAELASAGTLSGKLASGASSVMPFTAVKIPAVVEKAAAPDPESITRLKDPAEPFRFSGIDPRTGKTFTQDDFKGKPVIVDIFGTWCPNCHDEAPVLVELYNSYRQRGLEIVALSYEYTSEAARNARLIEIYRKKFGIPFMLLVSGTTDAGQIEKTLPQLEGFGAYPTTIFVGRDGRVQHIHAGFAGPATGQLADVKRRFVQNVEELLK